MALVIAFGISDLQNFTEQVDNGTGILGRVGDFVPETCAGGRLGFKVRIGRERNGCVVRREVRESDLFREGALFVAVAFAAAAALTRFRRPAHCGG